MKYSSHKFVFVCFIPVSLEQRGTLCGLCCSLCLLGFSRQSEIFRMRQSHSSVCVCVYFLCLHRVCVFLQSKESHLETVEQKWRSQTDALISSCFHVSIWECVCERVCVCISSVSTATTGVRMVDRNTTLLWHCCCGHLQYILRGSLSILFTYPELACRAQQGPHVQSELRVMQSKWSREKGLHHAKQKPCGPCRDTAISSSW